MMIKKIFAIACGIMLMSACSSKASQADANATTNESTDMIQPTDTTSTIVEVETTVGNFTILLYSDTPKHRDNFVKLVNDHYYDGVLFHRVIKDFMVQAGDPNSKTAKPGQMLGDGDPGYTIEAEINYPKHYHKRGALAAARTGDQINPERRSSGSQFYVVTGSKITPEQGESLKLQAAFGVLVEQNMQKIRQMQMAQDRPGLMALQDELEKQAQQMVAEGKSPITDEMVEVYVNEGGAPHLDGQYTVFGEVIKGMDTIEKIEKVETGAADRPVEDVKIISMKVVG